MVDIQQIDFHTKSDIQFAIRRIDEILTCGIFKTENQGHVLFRAAFIEVLIALRDLMYKSAKLGHRISFTDDVRVSGDVKDVTSLIKYVRDALCHPDSDNHYIDSGVKATFNVIFGQGCLQKINEFEQSSSYTDDICFFFGAQGIYLNRHVIRALNEAKQYLLPLLDNRRSVHEAM